MPISGDFHDKVPMHQSSPRAPWVRSAIVASALLFGFATVGCESDDTTGPSDPVLTTVVVVPGSQSMTTADAATQLTASARDENGDPIAGQTFTWESSNTNVAMVSTTGFVTPVSAGTSTITATTGDKSGTAVVTVTGFGGSYAMGSWSKGDIADGTTAIDPASGPAAEANFSYSVDLGSNGPGVSFRTTTFSVTCPRAGDFVFDWEYTGSHRFFQTLGVLEFQGTSSTTVVDQAVGSNFTFTGTSTVAVSAGGTFSIVVGGGNNDSNSRINGNVRIFNIRTP